MAEIIKIRGRVFIGGMLFLPPSQDCFELYKQVDFGDYQLLYTHDFRKTGDTPAAMVGDMEYHFKV